MLDYPLDGAIMPSSVKAPDVMWEQGTSVAGDLFRVRWTAGAATIDSIVAVDAAFTFDLTPSASDWQTLIDSAQGAPITVEVDHYDATSGAQAGAPASVTVVEANVVGAIDYWDLSQGRMQRIDANGRALGDPQPADVGQPGRDRQSMRRVPRGVARWQVPRGVAVERRRSGRRVRSETPR